MRFDCTKGASTKYMLIHRYNEVGTDHIFFHYLADARQKMNEIIDSNREYVLLEIMDIKTGAIKAYVRKGAHYAD